MTGVTYIEENGAIHRLAPDPSTREFYQANILVRSFGDLFGHAPVQAERLLRLPGTKFYSSSYSSYPEYLDEEIHSNGLNGCWIADPPGATPEYAGVRFDRPVKVSRFQFASCVGNPSECPGGAGPCAYPKTFTLDASNDGENWTTLLSVENYAGVRITLESPFPDENAARLSDETIFISGRLDVPNQGWFLFYRMNVMDFEPNIWSGYNVSEMIFYGFA